MSSQGPIRLLLFSTLFPSSVRPGHGIFVETRLRELLRSGQVKAKVVAPVPWFFSTHPRFGSYARVARTPGREDINGLDVHHPRYFLPPKVGMNVAPLLLALGALPTIRRLIKDGYDFDVIDAHYYYPDGVAAAMLASHLNKPFTVTARGSDINLLANYSIPRALMQWASRGAAASIAVSKSLMLAMRELGMPEARLITMPNGVDMEVFQIRPQVKARADLGWEHSPTLLSVGSLVENKGHDVAIEALTLLPEFRLVIAGEGPALEALNALALRLQVAARVEFIGQVDQRRLAMCYNAADILVLVSSREGWPNVLLESMACGTPVVASNVGGVPEIITSKRFGRIISARTAAGLVEAILDLWRDLPDRTVVQERAIEGGWQATTLAQLNLFERIQVNTAETPNA